MNHDGYLANTAVLDVVDEDKLAPCWTPTRLFETPNADIWMRHMAAGWQPVPGLETVTHRQIGLDDIEAAIVGVSCGSYVPIV